MDNRDPFDDTGADFLSEINVTPFIDVMLVLLIIFMITAPLMLGGVAVNLPKSVGDPLPRPEKPVIVSLSAESRLFVGNDEISYEERLNRFKDLARESDSGEIYVRGDGDIKYSRMMGLMAELGQAGFARVILVTELNNKASGSNRSDTPSQPSSGGSEINNHVTGQ